MGLSPGAGVQELPGGQSSNLSITSDPASLISSVIFYVDDSARSVNYVDIKQGTQGGIGGGLTAQTVKASSNVSGRLEAFALGTDNNLYLIRQDPSAPAGWLDPVAIASNVSAFEVLKDESGINHLVFSSRSGGQVRHIWQDPETTEWRREEVDLVTQQVEQIESYLTEITVLSGGAPVPDAPVKIFSDDPLSLEINGARVLIEAERPWEGAANPLGVVSLKIPTDTLGMPVLKVWAESLPDADLVEVDPAGLIRARLEGIQTSDLLGAMVTADDGSQIPLLTGDNRKETIVGAVATAVNAAMSLAPPGPDAGPGRLHPRTDRRIARYVAGHDGSNPNRIHLPSVREQHWRIDLSTGGVGFQSLGRDEAAALLARRADLALFDVEWGDLWESVKEGGNAIAADIKDFLVTTVIDPVTGLVTAINAQIALLVQGVEQLWEGTLDFLQQVMDVVESVFEAVQAGFDDLFRWLGFIFNWGEILRTKDALVHTIIQTIPIINQAVTSLEQQICNGVTVLKQGLDGKITGFIDNMLAGGGGSLSGLSEMYGPRSDGFESATGTNVIQAGLIDNIAGITSSGNTSRARHASALPDPIVALTTLLEQQFGPSGPFQGSQHFEDALGYFRGIGETPDRFLQLALAGLLRALEGIIELAIDVAAGVIVTFLKAVSALVDFLLDMLQEAWYIPFVSDLYKTHISPGNALTVLDLVCLLAAVPATIAYKAATGAAPFPGDPDLESFKSNYTTQWIQQVSGLGGGRMRPAGDPGDDAPPAWRMALLGICGLGNAFSTATYGVIGFFLDIVPANAGRTAPEKLSSIAIALEAIMFVTSNPWALDPSNSELFGCDDGVEFGNMVWLTTGSYPFLGDLWSFVYSKYSPDSSTFGHGIILRNKDDVGVAIDLSLGLLGTALALSVGAKNNWTPGLWVASAVISDVPALFKWIKFSFLFGSKPEALGVLGAIDGAGQILAGTLMFVYTTLALTSPGHGRDDAQLIRLESVRQ